MHLTVVHVVYLVVMLIANGVFVRFTMMKFKYIHFWVFNFQYVPKYSVLPVDKTHCCSENIELNIHSRLSCMPLGMHYSVITTSESCSVVLYWLTWFLSHERHTYRSNAVSLIFTPNISWLASPGTEPGMLVCQMDVATTTSSGAPHLILVHMDGHWLTSTVDNVVCATVTSNSPIKTGRTLTVEHTAID